MDTSMDRARGGAAGAKARQGLTDAKLRDLPPRERAYKVSDGGNGLYVVISPSGSRSFRYDYRLGGRRETLTIGRHEQVAPVRIGPGAMTEQHEAAFALLEVQRQVRDEGEALVVGGDQAGEGMGPHQLRGDGRVGGPELRWLVHVRDLLQRL